MNFLSLIEAKREGKTLAAEQIQEFIREFTAGKIPDYQMAAMLMAIYFSRTRHRRNHRAHARHARFRRRAEISQRPAPARGQAFHRRHRRQGFAPLAPLLAVSASACR